jgi:hypothetical protein
MKEILRLQQDHREKYKRLNAKWKSPKKKAEIEARKYELLQLQLSLVKSSDDSSQSFSKYVTLDKVCESIPEKDYGGQQTGNQSTTRKIMYTVRKYQIVLKDEMKMNSMMVYGRS